MQIHLSKPGGHREGPFTLEQINRDLAAKKYKDTDYWAWYEGLEGWVPLHSVPGISGRSAAEKPGGIPAPKAAPAPAPAPAEEDTGLFAARKQAEEEAEATPAPPSLREQLASGMPASALEQIFILTTGEGQAGSRSPVTAGMLQAVVSQDLETIRQSISRAAVGGCDFLERVRGGGSLPEAAWRALAKLKPQLVKDARAGAYKVCIRTFPIETGDVVALILFYNKEKL